MAHRTPSEKPTGLRQEPCETALEFRERRSREERGSDVYAIVVQPRFVNPGYVAYAHTVGGVDGRGCALTAEEAAHAALTQAMQRRRVREES